MGVGVLGAVGGLRVREHWREIDYWRWWWRKGMPSEAKVGVGVLLVGLLVASGWFVASRLTPAKASVAGTEDFLLQTTVRKVITVQKRGKVVRKIVPVVKQVVVTARAKTIYQTQPRNVTLVVTGPGRARVIHRVVTVNGKPPTVVQTRLVPTTRVQTPTRVVTNRQTVTTTKNVTQPGTTVRKTETVTLPASTVTKAVTLPASTVTKAVTLPASTVTKTETKTATQTQTVVQTQTVTQTQTQTITLPAATVTQTVTVTTPKPPKP
jgi:hypothetical protein